MRRTRLVITAVPALILLGLQSGCPVNPIVIPVPLQLGDALGLFQVEAGVPSELAGTTSFDTGGINIAAVNLEIDPSVVTFTPADAQAKSRLAQAGGTTIVVTAWLAPAADVNTVCGGGTQFGPFTVTLDANNNVTSISPSNIDLAPAIDLLNQGEVALCLRVESPISGTVRIETLTLNLSPGL